MGIDGFIEHLKTIPDWRRIRKVQHPLWLMLLMSLLGVMSGYSSLRGLEDFMKRHHHEVAPLLGLETVKPPSYSTLHDMTQHVDVYQVIEVFHQWVIQTCPLQPGDVVSIDGKALASTVSDCHGQQQDFVSIVSACVQQWQGVIAQCSFRNGAGSEIHSVRELLEHLDGHGVWITLDALHTQKNSV